MPNTFLVPPFHIMSWKESASPHERRLRATFPSHRLVFRA